MLNGHAGPYQNGAIPEPKIMAHTSHPTPPPPPTHTHLSPHLQVLVGVDASPRGSPLHTTAHPLKDTNPKQYRRASPHVRPTPTEKKNAALSVTTERRGIARHTRVYSMYTRHTPYFHTLCFTQHVHVTHRASSHGERRVHAAVSKATRQSNYDTLHSCGGRDGGDEK